jgi:hypothetical protein
VLFAFLSTALAFSSCPETWWALPEAVDTRPNYVERHRQLTWKVTTGRGANPVYRDSWARMDVDLWLKAQGQEGLLMDPTEQARYRDLTFTAATLAAEVLLDELTSRGELLSELNLAARTLTAPTLVVSDGLSLRPGASSRYQAQVASRMLEPGTRQPPKSRLVLGAGSNVVTDTLDPNAAVGWAWTAYLQSTRLGPDSLRVGMDVIQWQPGALEPLDSSLAWRAYGRHNLHPRLAVIGDTRSLPGSWQPQHARSGLEVKLIKKRRVFVRSTYTYGFERPSRPVEHRAEVRLMWTPRWRVPIAGEPAPWDAAAPRWTPRRPPDAVAQQRCIEPPIAVLSDGVVAGP